MKVAMRIVTIGLSCLVIPAMAVADYEGKGRHGPGGFQAAREIVREFCQKNPDDSRCQEIKANREQRHQRFQACKDNPSGEGCERINAWRERKKEKCAANPEKPFCNHLRGEDQAQ